MNSNQIKFNKHNVSNGAIKARVRYSLDNHVNGKPCVWINAKDYDAGDSLALIIPNGYSNNTDSRQDVFEKGKVILFENHPLYASAREKIMTFISATIRATYFRNNPRFGRTTTLVIDGIAVLEVMGIVGKRAMLRQWKLTR